MVLESNKIPISWLNGDEDEKVFLSKRITKFVADDSSPKERKIAENIARILLNDISLKVREALAQELRVCQTLPADIIDRIATDVECVACPFLEGSQAISQEHMLKLIPVIKEYARVSVAKRKDVTSDISMSLIEFASDDTITVLMQNPSAKLNEQVCEQMLDRFEASHPNLELLASRIDLPNDLKEELAKSISSHYMKAIDNKYDFDNSISSHLDNWFYDPDVGQMKGRRDTDEIEAYVRKLHALGRLTPEIILENLQKGDTIFFETSMNKLSGTPKENIRHLVEHGGTIAIEKLLLAANISKAYLKKFRSSLSKAYGTKI